MPADLRPSWRLSILLLLLKNCSNQATSSIRRIEYLEAALHKPKLAEGISRRDFNTMEYVGSDPTTSRVIHLAVAYRLIQRTPSGRYVLTTVGNEVAGQLMSQVDFALEEKRVMSALGQHLTEKAVEKLDEVRAQ